MLKKSLCIVFVLLLLPVLAQASDRSEYYMGGNLGLSMADLDTGGFNSAGGFSNTGKDSNNSWMREIVFGKACGPWRTELSLSNHGQYDFTTDSYQLDEEEFRDEVRTREIAPSASVILDSQVMPVQFVEGYFYDSHIDNKALMLSLYYDFMLRSNQRWNPYVGAGLGFARTEVEVTDGVVQGNNTEDNFVWQVGVGASYKVTNSADIQFGYRYINFGTTRVGLENIEREGPDAGDFKADLDVSEVFFGVRWKFGASGV